jgi:hypothetical protein
MIIYETNRAEMTPEEAIAYAKQLTSAANMVLRARAKGKEDAYAYQNMCGRNPLTGKDRFFHVRIGNLTY